MFWMSSSRMVSAMALMCWATTMPAMAQPVSPSFDCAKASGTVEELICADPELATLDTRLTQRFADTMTTIRNMDAGASTAEAELKAIQRGWIKGRNECWKAVDIPTCVSDAYLIREGELVALWMLEEPQAVARYACNSTPANEVYVFYFATERPSVRLEYGDSIRAGHLTRSASGAKYMTPFGGSFWIKGNDAIFVPEEGTKLACQLVN